MASGRSRMTCVRSDMPRVTASMTYMPVMPEHGYRHKYQSRQPDDEESDKDRHGSFLPNSLEKPFRD